MNKTKKINLRSFRELLLVGVVIVLCMIWTIMNSQFLSANNTVSYTHLSRDTMSLSATPMRMWRRKSGISRTCMADRWTA